MAPFMKTALELRLQGVTNDRDDPSVSNSLQILFLYPSIVLHLG